MIAVLVVVLLVAIGIIGFLLYKRGGSEPTYAASPAPKVVAKSGTRSPAPVEDDEESTTVRIVGHRVTRIEKGVKVGMEIPIVGIVTVGSGPDSKIRLDDPYVAPKHLDFRLENGKAFVVDEGSDTGTDVNGIRLECFVPRLLNDGDKILAGSTQFLYKSG